MVATGAYKMADQTEVLLLSVPWLLFHHKTWNTKSHLGGCGMNCECCRAHNAEDCDSGGCEMCERGWTLTAVSVAVKKTVQNYGRLLKLCPCGQCRPGWFDCGWKSSSEILTVQVIMWQ